MAAKWCLLTAYDSGFANVAAHSIVAMERYANIYGMTFRKIIDRDVGRPPAWAKLYLTRECFDEGFDFVFWVDADAVVRRFDEDIRNVVIDGADFYFARESYPIPGSRSLWRLNTGVYVMRNSPAARKLLDESIAREEYINHEWWDQAAVSAVFGYWSVFWRSHEHKADEATDLARRIRWLAPKWNASPVYAPEPNAIIHHYYGLRGRGKVAAMEIDAAFDRLGERTADISQTLTTVLKLLEPSLRNGLPVVAPSPTRPSFDLRRGMKALRSRPWRLWTAKGWAKRQFVSRAT